MLKKIEEKTTLFMGELLTLFAGIIIGLKLAGQFRLGWGMTIAFSIAFMYINEYIQYSIYSRNQKEENESK